MNLSYRLLNVFTDGDNPFSGNPLCVFEDATGLSDNDMQDLARQLNLSETTFITPGDGDVSANVRIFTPNYEMPFAGHPTLGTAYVVHELFAGGDAILLRMPAGDIPVRVADNVWTLQANAPTSFPVEVARSDLTAMVGLTADRVAAEPLWVDAGTVQLILPLKSAEDVRAASADPKLLAEFATRPGGESLVYLWAPTGPDTIEARLFFTQNNAAIEDPATGSACANLGGWFLANGERGIRRRIHQGSAIQRPSVLDLAVDGKGTIFVSGAVREVGRGTFAI
ncbi:MAG: PhzF family phenazine biosynthesis protein [Actinobacteria bacterium]|nr:PhzF family phenazine biosynthesis protein [Actinomycetota bacterium]